MANPVRQAITATGSATPILLDFFNAPFNATVGVDLSQAVGATYTVQYTLADIESLLGVTVTSPLWRPDPTLGTAQTNSGVTYYTSPIIAVRIVVSALTSGTIFVEVVQGISTPA